MFEICLALASLGATPASASVALTSEFRAAEFRQPDAALWPGYFWLWNTALDPETVRAQLRDMAAHDARSVCMLPMPHGFRRIPPTMPGPRLPDVRLL